MFEKTKLVAIDADDTLWHDRIWFHNLKNTYIFLGSKNHSSMKLNEAFNRNLVGKGEKNYIDAILASALELDYSSQDLDILTQKTFELQNYPIVLLPDVVTGLTILYRKYSLILVTQGEINRQRDKIKKSQLSSFFRKIYVLADKDIDEWKKVIKAELVEPSEVLVIGDNITKDIKPAIECGCSYIWIRYDNKKDENNVIKNNWGDVCDLFS